MKFYGCVLLCFSIFLLACPQRRTRDRDLYDRYNRYNYDERRRDDRGYFYDENARLREIQRLQNTGGIIEARLDSRFEGGWYYAGYDREPCRDREACKRICDEDIPLENQAVCYNSPREVVEQLIDASRTLLNISTVDPVDITPGLIAGMLRIRIDFILDLVERKMSEGDLKSFLAWVAINRDIAEVFFSRRQKNRNHEKRF